MFIGNSPKYKSYLTLLMIILSSMTFSSCDMFMNALVDEIAGTGTSNPTSASAKQYSYSSKAKATQSNSPMTKMVKEEYQEPHKTRCVTCSGTGKCLKCHGSGKVRSGVGVKGIKDGSKCSSCRGHGTCIKCGGSRYITTYTTRYRYVKKVIDSTSSSDDSSEDDNDSEETDNASSKETYHTCSWCNGSGRIKKETTQYGFSVQGKEKGKCSECGEQLYEGQGHRHENCSHCKGTGKLKN